MKYTKGTHLNATRESRIRNRCVNSSHLLAGATSGISIDPHEPQFNAECLRASLKLGNCVVNESLDYTGERMVPEKADKYTFWEHIYRYRFAAAFVSNKRVLDIACGEGYGTAALMRAGAASVIGVDVAAEACEHATRRYGIEARLGDAEKIPLASSSVDAIVSFETIEHVSKPEKFLDECVRVLAPGGRIVISTPNRDAYLKNAPKNPYHLNELDEKEFLSLIVARFSTALFYTQRPVFASWWSLRSLASDASFWQRVRGFGRLRRLLQMGCCREIVDSVALQRARENPIQSILTRQDSLSCLANPFAVRPKSACSRETPIYMIAVATL
jgi:2-polyprenyl-3-methyl-5-hydroxy-6-metoxy-1,4-benzoquinol methylase